MRPLALPAFALVSLLAAPLLAEPLSKKTDLDFFRDVPSRNLKGLATRSDGRLVAGPTLSEFVVSAPADLLWCLEPTPEPTKWLIGTGPDGKIFEITFNISDATYGTRDIIDGTSNTLAFSERVQANFNIGGKATPDIREGTLTSVAGITSSPGACLAATAPIVAANRYTNGALVKGRFSSTWCDGQPENVSFYSILAPNSVSCVSDNNTNSDAAVNLLSASSYHSGGVTALMADGAVRFISNNIDTGNLGVASTLGGKSPYGVWGGLGTKNGGETLGDF